MSFKKVRKRLEIKNKFIDSIIIGKFPHFKIDCDERYTKELTITIFRWLLYSDLYYDYDKICNWLKTNGDLEEKKMAEVILSNTEEKRKRRYKLT